MVITNYFRQPEGDKLDGGALNSTGHGASQAPMLSTAREMNNLKKGKKFKKCKCCQRKLKKM